MPKEKKYQQNAGEYIEAIGRRKTSAARVRLIKGNAGVFSVNEIKPDEYFKTDEQRRVAHEIFSVHSPAKEKYGISAIVSGGGLSSQAEALRHGVARAIISAEPELRTMIKKAGFLKRDPRAKERRKFGRKGKARKSPQWSKR
jgi:small subunit ribosomal protein S9